MKSESINDLDFSRRCLSRRTFLVYQVMFFVACVDETRKKKYYRYELYSFSCRAIHISVDKGTLLSVT